jgi:hypothetical protein
MTYHVRFRVYSTNAVKERSFDTALARTLFVIGLESNGLATVIEEWTDVRCCDGNDPACPTHVVAASNARQNERMR